MTHSANKAETYDAFFYGTLLHPKVLQRVIRTNGGHLRIAPAILEGYTRHKVNFSDFPAIISAEASHKAFGTEPNVESDCIRGSFVRGLTAVDMAHLDAFESGLYTRKAVEVTLLAEPVGLIEVEVKTLLEQEPGTIHRSRKVPVVTYIWNKALSQLGAEPWSFEEFVETKLSRWA